MARSGAVIAYLDTNIVYRLISRRLDTISVETQRLMEEADLLISPAVVLELQLLHEINRLTVSATTIVGSLAQSIGLRVCALPMTTVVGAALELEWMRDPFDRLIVAQAIANERAPLVTIDRKIRERYAGAVS